MGLPPRSPSFFPRLAQGPEGTLFSLSVPLGSVFLALAPPPSPVLALDFLWESPLSRVFEPSPKAPDPLAIGCSRSHRPFFRFLRHPTRTGEESGKWSGLDSQARRSQGRVPETLGPPFPSLPSSPPFPLCAGSPQPCVLPFPWYGPSGSLFAPLSPLPLGRDDGRLLNTAEGPRFLSDASSDDGGGHQRHRRRGGRVRRAARGPVGTVIIEDKLIPLTSLNPACHTN